MLNPALCAQSEKTLCSPASRRAVIATLIENCKLSGINPHARLSDTLTKLANGHPANKQRR